MSSYHVCFLESHEGQALSDHPIPEIPAGSTSIESIVKNATPTPIFFDDDDEEYLPFHKPPKNIPTSQEPVIIPETIPCRSNCIAEKLLDLKPLHLDKAIQDSTEAETRVKAACAERKKMLQDLREEEKRNAPTVVKDVMGKSWVDALILTYEIFWFYIDLQNPAIIVTWS